jgi:hypothetical protein
VRLCLWTATTNRPIFDPSDGRLILRHRVKLMLKAPPPACRLRNDEDKKQIKAILLSVLFVLLNFVSFATLLTLYLVCQATKMAYETYGCWTAVFSYKRLMDSLIHLSLKWTCSGDNTEGQCCKLWRPRPQWDAEVQIQLSASEMFQMRKEEHISHRQALHMFLLHVGVFRSLRLSAGIHQLSFLKQSRVYFDLQERTCRFKYC